MKNLKHGLVFVTIIGVTLIISYLNMHAVPYVILALFLIHLSIRKMAWARPYFTSKYNILTSKSHYNKEYDFSKDILFHKLLEVVESSGFKIVSVNEEKGEIFATSSMTWFSWGENLYLDVVKNENGSSMNLTSAGFFQLSYSFGKNERNYQRLVSNFEESLTI